MEAMLRGSQLFHQEWAREKARIGYSGMTRAEKKLAYAQFRAHRNAQSGKSNSARLKATLDSSRVGGIYQMRRKVKVSVPKLDEFGNPIYRDYTLSVPALSKRLKRYAPEDALTVAYSEQTDPTIRKKISDIYKNPAYKQYPLTKIIRKRKNPPTEPKERKPRKERAPKKERKPRPELILHPINPEFHAKNLREAKKEFLRVHHGEMSDAALRRRFPKLYYETLQGKYQGQGVRRAGGMLAGEPSFY